MFVCTHRCRGPVPNCLLPFSWQPAHLLTCTCRAPSAAVHKLTARHTHAPLPHVLDVLQRHHAHEAHAHDCASACTHNALPLQQVMGKLLGVRQSHPVLYAVQLVPVQQLLHTEQHLERHSPVSEHPDCAADHSMRGAEDSPHLHAQSTTSQDWAPTTPLTSTGSPLPSSWGCLHPCRQLPACRGTPASMPRAVSQQLG